MPPDPDTGRERAGAVSAGDRIRNFPAFVSLCCGLSCLVPWVVVITFPPAIVLGVVGLIKSFGLPDRQGRSAALMGMGLAVGFAALQFALVGLAGLIGFL